MTEIRSVAYYYIDGIHIQTIFSDGKARLLVFDGSIARRVDEYTLPCSDTVLRPLTDYLGKGYLVPSDYSNEAIPKLAGDLFTFYRRNLLLHDSDIWLMVFYCWYTWFYDLTQTAPYLYLRGSHGTAKTRAKDLLAHTCFNATDLGTTVTPAIIFRMQDKVRGTLFLDEVEMTDSEGHHAMVQILNEGYKAGGVVYRNERRSGEDSWVPISYSVFGPKVVVSRSEPKDQSLKSRFYLIRMPRVTRKKMKKAGVDINFTPEAKQEAIELRNRLFGLRCYYYKEVPFRLCAEATSDIPRDAQLVESILSVLPSKIQSIVLPILESHLYLSTEKFREYQVEHKVVGVLRNLSSVEQVTYPAQFLFAAIIQEIKALSGQDYNPREIGAASRRMSLETKHTNSGQAVVIRSRDEIAQLCQRYGIHDTESVVEKKE